MQNNNQTENNSPLEAFDDVFAALAPQIQDDNVVNLDNGGEHKIPGDDNDILNDGDAKSIDDDSNDHADDNADGADTNQANGNSSNFDDIDDVESAQVGLLYDAFAESFGWDGDEENKPTTIEDLIDQVRKEATVNAAENYASDEVRELDQFIKNGGRFEDYFEMNSQAITYDSIDLTDEDNQKYVLSTFLKVKGYNDEQIKRKLEKYEDAGLLEDEATEAVDFLKEATKQQKEQVLKQQEQVRIQQEQAQREFYTNVTKDIKTLTDIRGVKIPEQDKKALQDYIFKVGSDGQTAYQRDYAKNISKNLLESAYFTMKGDALINSAKNKGETSAINKLKQSLRSTRMSSKHDIDNDSVLPVWAASSLSRN